MISRKTERVECPTCGCGRGRRHISAPDLLSPERTEWRFARCCGCGFIYLNPRPTREDIARYYPETRYYSFAEEAHYKPPSEGTLKRALRDFILHEHLGYPQLGPADNLPRAGSALGRSLWRWLTLPLASRFSYALPWREGGRLLDVGCGSGESLAVQRELGWQVKGIEISPQAVRFGRERLGLDIFEGTIEDAQFAEESFDLISFNHSLEHMHDPAAALKRAHALLRKGGMLRVGVPNGDALGAGLWGRCWRGYDPPRHLSVFTYGALAALLRQAGFSRVRPAPPRGAHRAFLVSLETFLREKAGLNLPLRAWRTFSAAFGLLYRLVIPGRWRDHLLMIAEKR